MTGNKTSSEKLWCYGSDDAPMAVISALESRGAVNMYGEDGMGADSIYYTDRDGYIRRNDPVEAAQRLRITTDRAYRRIFPPCANRKYAVRISGVEASLVGVLEINRAYCKALAEMSRGGCLWIESVPFCGDDERSLWIDARTSLPGKTERVLCRAENGVIMAGYAAAGQDGAPLIVPDEGIAPGTYRLAQWMPIPE